MTLRLHIGAEDLLLKQPYVCLSSRTRQWSHIVRLSDEPTRLRHFSEVPLLQKDMEWVELNEYDRSTPIALFEDAGETGVAYRGRVSVPLARDVIGCTICRRHQPVG